MWHNFLFLIAVIRSSTAVILPTFSPSNKQICSGYQHNWAAEIRCLRTNLDWCSFNISLHPPSKPLSYTERKERSANESHFQSTLRSSRKKNSDAPACNCNDEKLKHLEEHFSKKLYEIKMKTAYDNEMRISELQRKFDLDLRLYQTAVIKDILDLRRKLDFLEAPRIVNNDVEYFLIQREESWYTASEKCISYGGHLVSIHSRLENSLISSLIPKNTTAWIGVNDIQKENVFKNADGSLIDYFYWSKGQPNNEEYNENCVEIDHNGVWNDKLCIIARPFICKKVNLK